MSAFIRHKQTMIRVSMTMETNGEEIVMKERQGKWGHLFTKI